MTYLISTKYFQYQHHQYLGVVQCTQLTMCVSLLHTALSLQQQAASLARCPDALCCNKPVLSCWSAASHDAVCGSLLAAMPCHIIFGSVTRDYISQYKRCIPCNCCAAGTCCSFVLAFSACYCNLLHIRWFQCKQQQGQQLIASTAYCGLRMP